MRGSMRSGIFPWLSSMPTVGQRRTNQPTTGTPQSQSEYRGTCRVDYIGHRQRCRLGGINVFFYKKNGMCKYFEMFNEQMRLCVYNLYTYPQKGGTYMDPSNQ